MLDPAAYEKRRLDREKAPITERVNQNGKPLFLWRPSPPRDARKEQEQREEEEEEESKKPKREGKKENDSTIVKKEKGSDAESSDSDGETTKAAKGARAPVGCGPCW